MYPKNAIIAMASFSLAVVAHAESISVDPSSVPGVSPAGVRAQVLRSTRSHGASEAARPSLDGAPSEPQDGARSLVTVLGEARATGWMEHRTEWLDAPGRIARTWPLALAELGVTGAAPANAAIAGVCTTSTWLDTIPSSRGDYAAFMPILAEASRDQVVVVPLPPSVYAGLLLVGGVMGSSYIIRRRRLQQS